MRRRNYALAIAALGATLAASCWHPSFDPAISASELTIRKLGEPILYFTVDMQGNDMDAIWFAPQLLESPSVGLLVQDMGTKLRIRGVSISGFNHTGFSYYSDEYANSLGDAYLVQTAPDGSTAAFIVSGAGTGRYLDISTWTPTDVAMPATQGPFGIETQTVPMTNNKYFTVFTMDMGTGDPQYTEYTWNSGIPSFPAPTTMAFADAANVSTPGRFLSAGGFLYLSCGLADGSRTIFRWVNPPAASEPTGYSEDYGPLIGALSDGRLLAEENETISVLDANLQKLFSFPSGRLRFVHERYESLTSEMRCVFTRSIFVRTSSHDDYGQLFVEVYEIATANLSDLAD